MYISGIVKYLESVINNYTELAHIVDGLFKPNQRWRLKEGFIGSTGFSSVFGANNMETMGYLLHFRG